jgi:DMSO/TMAO reductase YedYZ heme-binding membrane subunit
LIYISAAAAVVHFWWKVKADHLLPSIYGLIFILFMLLRLARRPQEYRK